MYVGEVTLQLQFLSLISVPAAIFSLTICSLRMDRLLAQGER